MRTSLTSSLSKSKTIPVDNEGESKRGHVSKVIAHPHTRLRDSQKLLTR